jgi:NAD(P)-dependent dehydrogenase (short-subunit alcohol dehydrogenase family)
MGILQDKTCIVTGAAGSLGLASVRRFVAEGARVMMVDRDRAALNAALKSLPEGRATAMLADVTSAKDTVAYVTATVARWGPIDVLFSNAGIGGVVLPVTDYPEDVFDQVLAVNLKGSFLACKHGLPAMRDGGSIVMTASVVAVTSDPGIAAYAASLATVRIRPISPCLEAAGRRIRVNAVAPGPIDNGFQREIEKGLTRALGADGGKFLDSVIPLRRHATAEEVTESVLFLASERSAFTTGSVLMADGGMHV